MKRPLLTVIALLTTAIVSAIAHVSGAPQPLPHQIVPGDRDGLIPCNVEAIVKSYM